MKTDLTSIESQELHDSLTNDLIRQGYIKQNKGYRENLNQIALKQQLLVQTDTDVLILPIRVPTGNELTTVDTVHFIFGIETIDESLIDVLIDDEISKQDRLNLCDEFIHNLTAELGDIFGSEFTEVSYSGKGLHFYKFTYYIGDYDRMLGTISFGKQNNTVHITINGTGCYWADDYWEYNLYNWLKYDAYRTKISRIDICLDDIQGLYSSPELADLADDRGLFSLTNMQPSVQKLGDWKHHKGNGRTFQVGHRRNGKLYRGYEKGKKYGDKESLWFRSEVEFGQKSRLLPFDMLIKPTEYFAGAYPYCLELLELSNSQPLDTVSRIPVIKKQAEISLEKSIDIWRRQSGRYINAYKELFVYKDESGKVVPDYQQIVEMLSADEQKSYPERLKVHEKFIKNPPSYAPWADRRSKCETIPYED